MVIDSFQERFVMNMQLWQVFAEPSLSDWKKAEKNRFCLAFLDFQNKPKALKKSQNFQNEILASKKPNWQPWWNARYSHPVAHFCDIRQCWSENTSQLIPFCLTTTSFIAEIRFLKNFDWLLHRTQCWLRLLLEPKILTPAPAPA